MVLQVFAFVKSDQSNDSPHRADCHVCESLLEFRTKAEVISPFLFRRPEKSAYVLFES